MHSRPGSGRNCSLRFSIVHKDSVFPRSWVVLHYAEDRKKEWARGRVEAPEAPKGHPISVNAVITSAALSSKTTTSSSARIGQMEENPLRRIRSARNNVTTMSTWILSFNARIDRNCIREDNGALNQNFMRKVAPLNRVPRLLCRNE